MRHLGLFEGIGGFTLAAERAGMASGMACEVDERCQEVLADRLPHLLQFGDVSHLDAESARGGPYDVVTAGSPCQDFSIAGLRQGLAGSRSGLFEHFIRLVDELQPRFAVWENVPGALTSNKGADFANVLGALVGAEGPLRLPKHPNGRRSRYAGVAHGPAGTLAWRVLDAQHFGVPQRRQRIFAALDTQGWDSIRVLFPDEAGDPRSSRIDVQRGSAWASCWDLDGLPTGMDVGAHPPVRLADILEPDVDERYYLSPKACIGILRRANKRTRTLPPVLDYALRCQAGEEVGDPPTYDMPEIASTLRGGGERGYRIGAEDAAGGHLVPVLVKQREGKPGGGKGPLLSPDLSLTLATGNDQFLFEPQALSQNSRDEVRLSEVAPALSGGGGKPGQGYSAIVEPVHALNARQDPIVTEDLLAGPLGTDGTTHAVASPPLYRVRRLTPVECERLQGFPDGWTDVDGAKDSQRYRQLGNAVAVPVAEWLMRRIEECA